MTPQLSATLADLTVELGGVRLPVDQLCGGTLVCGMTGSGKTVSVVNPLTTQFAALEMDRPERKPAVIYFSLKGQPHRQFLESLPCARRRDVVMVSHSSPVWLSLFHKANWRSEMELNGAVVRFVEELSQHFSGDFGNERRDPFWDRQRLRYCTILAGLEVEHPRQLLGDRELRDLDGPDALRSLIARMDVFFEYCTNTAPETLKAHGLDPDPQPGETEVAMARECYARYFPDPKDWPADPRVEKGLTRMILNLTDRNVAKPLATKLGKFHAALTTDSKLRLNAMVLEFCRLADATKYSILADTRGVLDTFKAAETKRYLYGEGSAPLTIEEIVHEGKIVVIDLPLADGGNSSLPVLLAIKLALFNRLLGRNSALFHGQPLCRRPVCVVIDEFQNLISKGRTGGEDLMLAQCREHGISVLLASQSLSLLSGVLMSNAKLAALVANCRTKIFGRNGDAVTNQVAAEACGMQDSHTIQRAPVWYGGASFREFVTEPGSGGRPLVGPEQFGALKTGQFYLASPGGGTYWLDLRHQLPAPVAKTLKEPAE